MTMQSTGTVFDIGYRRYDGPRESRPRARRAVFKNGVRIALGLGRGPRAKALPWAFLSLLTAIGLIMSFVAGAAERFAGPGAAKRLELPSHSDFYGIASIVMFAFAAIVAPELLCRDRRERVINLYLVRPLTSLDYLLCRWAAFLVVMTIAAWVPQIVLFLGLMEGGTQPIQYLRDHWTDIPKFLLSGFALAAYLTTLAMLVASFTTRRAYAAVFLIGIFVISTPFTLGMARNVGGLTGQWISMFNLTNIPVHVNDIIFGVPSAITREAPARDFAPAVLIAWYLAWTVVPFAILCWRYRKLDA